MSTKPNEHKCALVLIADGFNEIETIVMLSILRQAGLCAKGVGLTSGLCRGAHGILVMPDCTLTNLSHTVRGATVSLVILPGGMSCVSRLEADPRVHKLLGQVVAAHGSIVADEYGLGLLKTALGSDIGNSLFMDRIIWKNRDESHEAFARQLAHRAM